MNSNNPENKSFTDPEGREITIADDDLMGKFYDTDVFKILCIEVLDFEPEEIMVTDETYLTDFPEDRSYYVDKVKEVFNVDISDMDPLVLPEVLQRIVDSCQPKY